MGKEEWLGVLPFDENPQGINPPEGFYANWNNRPSHDWPYCEGSQVWQNGCWGENVCQIQKLLIADDSITVQDMQDICKTVADMDWPTPCWINHLRDAIDTVGGVHPAVEAAIDSWDCMLRDVDEDCCYDDPGFTIFWEWFFELYDQLLADEIPTDVHLSWCDLGLYYRILNSEEATLELNYKQYLNGEAKDELIVDALHDACDTLETRYGTSDVSQWLSDIMWLTVNDPVFTEVGNLESPEKLGYVLPFMNRGTYNQITEMPLWIRSNPTDPPIGVNVLPCGQSGFVQYPDIPSPHAYDQLDLYLDWEFKPMLYNLSSS
jgi:penicillin amidase